MAHTPARRLAVHLLPSPCPTAHAHPTAPVPAARIRQSGRDRHRARAGTDRASHAPATRPTTPRLRLCAARHPPLVNRHRLYLAPVPRDSIKHLGPDSTEARPLHTVRLPVKIFSPRSKPRQNGRWGRGKREKGFSGAAKRTAVFFLMGTVVLGCECWVGG